MPWRERAASGAAVRGPVGDILRCSTTLAAMDDTDREILRALTADARLPYRELGTRVGLSANAVAARVRRMRRDAVITRFTVELGPGAGGGRSDGPGGSVGHSAGLELFLDVRL